MAICIKKELNFLYISQEITERIKARVKEKNTSIGEMLSACGLGVNTISKMSKGTDILTKNFAKIADYLDCSVDYLLGRTDVPEPNKGNNHSQLILTAAHSGDEIGTKPFTPEQEAYIDKLIEKKNNEKN